MPPGELHPRLQQAADRGARPRSSFVCCPACVSHYEYCSARAPSFSTTRRLGASNTRPWAHSLSNCLTRMRRGVFMSRFQIFWNINPSAARTPARTAVRIGAMEGSSTRAGQLTVWGGDAAGVAQGVAARSEKRKRKSGYLGVEHPPSDNPRTLMLSEKPRMLWHGLVVRVSTAWPLGLCFSPA